MFSAWRPVLLVLVSPCSSLAGASLWNYGHGSGEGGHDQIITGKGVASTFWNMAQQFSCRVGRSVLVMCHHASSDFGFMSDAASIKHFKCADICFVTRQQAHNRVTGVNDDVWIIMCLIDEYPPHVKPSFISELLSP